MTGFNYQMKSKDPVGLHKAAHAKSDVDHSDSSQHHTLGMGLHQAARGSDLKKLQDEIEALTARIETLEGYHP